MADNVGEIELEEPVVKQVIETKNSLSTDRLDMSFGEIMNMFEDKEIIISPEFQRLFRWSIEQQTRFIESILLGIPIPPIFVAEDKNGKWEVVDGLQRISTVLAFFGLLTSMQDKNMSTLCEGELVPLLDGYNVKTLPLKLKLNIKRSVCRIEIIKWNSKRDMRYELFNRLNTGGSPLTDQEIRNCIFRDTSVDFNHYLQRLSEKTIFLILINPSIKQQAELYPQELVLRFTALYNDWSQINEPMSSFMTTYMKKSVNDSQYDFVRMESIFDQVINILSPLGSDIFRFDNNIFSTSLFDAITIGIATYIDYYTKCPPGEILEKIKTLKANADFRKYTGSAANSKTRVINRIKISLNIFKVE
jgi:hypothetical protein